MSFNKIKAYAIENKPDLCIGAGIAAGLAAVVLTFIKAPKVSKIIEEAKLTCKGIKEVEAEAKDAPDYKAEDYRKAEIIVGTKAGLTAAKEMILPAAAEIASIALIVAGFKEQKNRTATAIGLFTAATKALDLKTKELNDYREEVKKAVGEEKENEIHDKVTKKDQNKVFDENGNPVQFQEKKAPTDCPFGLYDFLFQLGDKFWQDDAGNNLVFLRNKERQLNMMLEGNGYVFLKDVYDVLGIKATKESAMVGWIFDPKNKSRANYIDLGIESVYDKYLRGVDVDPNIWLHPNCDGIILGDDESNFARYAK